MWPSGSQSDAVASARSLATELRCPDCEGLSVADSNAPTSTAIRADIRRRIADGQSDDEIRQSYVDKYDESILLSPAELGLGLLVWVPAGRSCSRSAPPASSSRSARAARAAPRTPPHADEGWSTASEGSSA